MTRPRRAATPFPGRPTSRSSVIAGPRLGHGGAIGSRATGRETLAYFTARPTQAKRDSDFALDYVRRHARTAPEQEAVLAALRFKCDVLWVQLDALWGAYVDGNIPPGAWRPGEVAP